MLVLTRQPTMQRENTSITKATYSQPCQVDTYVKSLIHSWFGRCALNCRLTRSCGHGARASQLSSVCAVQSTVLLPRAAVAHAATRLVQGLTFWGCLR